ncbi:hypothetical protein V8C37DRAFT_385978 [Trichoderma ceciliae]
MEISTVVSDKSTMRTNSTIRSRLPFTASNHWTNSTYSTSHDGYPGGVDVVYEAVNEHITSHVDAVVSLKLSETVLRPISLQQIKREQSFVGSLTV